MRVDETALGYRLLISSKEIVGGETTRGTRVEYG